MTPRHDGGPDTGPQVVAALLHMQAPELAGLPLQLLANTGSDNTLYRLGSGFVVRLPRFADAAARLDVELDWLARLTELPVAVPEIVHAGEPAGSYPYRWAVLRWLVGVDAWHARHHEDGFGPDLGHDLATVVAQLRATPVADAPRREPGQRGGPLHALDALDAARPHPLILSVEVIDTQEESDPAGELLTHGGGLRRSVGLRQEEQGGIGRQPAHRARRPTHPRRPQRLRRAAHCRQARLSGTRPSGTAAIHADLQDQRPDRDEADLSSPPELAWETRAGISSRLELSQARSGPDGETRLFMPA